MTLLLRLGLILLSCLIIQAYSINTQTDVDVIKGKLQKKTANISASTHMHSVYGAFLQSAPNFSPEQLSGFASIAYTDLTKYKDALESLKKHANQMKVIVDWANEYPGLSRVVSGILEVSGDRSKDEFLSHDCDDLHWKKTGLRFINPKRQTPFQVWCEFNYEGGNWTVIQQRQDGTVNFQRSWLEYRDGFGNLDGEFWLGNEKIHRITSNGRYELRIDLRDWEDKSWFAVYKTFTVGGENSNYQLTIRDYSGTAVDSLSYHSKMGFSTRDRDNDEYSLHCSKTDGGEGGWWFKSCKHSNLNGLHTKGSGSNGVYWNHAKNINMKYTRMMIRRV